MPQRKSSFLKTGELASFFTVTLLSTDCDKRQKKKKKPGRAFWCLSVRESGSREMVERCSFLTVYVVVGVMDVIEGTGKREENK